MMLLLLLNIVIHSHVKSVSVRDGDHLKTNSWGLDPKAKPDTYFTDFPRAGKKITFITDIDSVSFDTEYGHTYDFTIVLNNKDSCFTRISANYNGATLLKSATSDTIPFVLRNNRIYFTGTVNGRKGVRIMFDLGAGMSCVNINSVAKTGMRFDTQQLLTNTNGTNTELSSSNNSIVLGNLKWDSMPVVQVRNLDAGDDMIIGNSLFRDQIIEIDYDRRIMVVHHQPIPHPGYSTHPIQIDQHRPFININMQVDDQQYSGWFLFDTGRDGTMLIGDDFTGTHDIWQRFFSLFKFGGKKIVVIPAVQVAGLTFTNVLTNARDPAHPNGKQSLLGNTVLKQFNVILDNRNGVMYLKPNSLRGSGYSDWRWYRLWFGGVIVLLIGILLKRLF